MGYCTIFPFLEHCEVDAVGVQKSRIQGYIYTIILSQCEKKWILSKEEKRSSCSSKALEKKVAEKLGQIIWVDYKISYSKSLSNTVCWDQKFYQPCCSN